ncbi:MAG TPA: TonB-dependent receptor [Candidatus Aminicenantes bacterium]|nr:TonB-dependent receptor [Candidatus Aminicenantes bacterium]HRY66157.1 TonB-dependent receptor [Candidatus Aminicenantes bacterium]HRZ73071.1 TonB-dependent receptor [Candidatus Aminicenantes bacterium]
MKMLRSIGVFAVVVLLLAGVLSAQVPTAGRIIGTVIDDQGAPLPGVAVEAKSPRLVGKAATVTDANGVYRLLALPPGAYRITFKLQGFADIVRSDIVLGVEQALVVDAAMKPSSVEEEVVVVGQAPLIDVKNSARGQVLTAETFNALPKGRTFDSLVTILPGVQSEDDLLSGISVDGASGAENVFFVDGTDTSDLLGGTRKQKVVFDFADEVQFKASGYNAEYGGSVGGVVNVITRSGGNAYRGELVGYYTGTGLEGTRRDRLSLDLSDNTQARYYPYSEYVGQDKEHSFEGGFLLGGYILKDRLWFFGALTPSLFRRDRTMDMAIQGVSALNAYERTETTWNASFKLSAQPLKNLRAGASVVMNLFKYKGGSDPTTFPSDQTYAATSNATADYQNLGYSYPNYSMTAYADLTLSNNALLSVRGGYFYNNQNHRLAALPTTPYYGFRLEQPSSYAFVTNSMFPEIPAELVHPAGWQNFPRANVMGLAQRMDSRLSANADFTYYLNAGGEHAFKAGLQFMRRTQNVNDGAQQPIIFLGWDQDLIAYNVNYGRGDYGYYAVRGFADAGPYGEGYKVNMNSWSLYLQDSWTIAGRLTLNLGLRAEAEYLPSYTTDPAFAGIKKPISFSFADKLAPRFGFSYDVFGDSSFKVFGSFGIFQDVMKLNMGANGLGGLKWKSAYYTLDDWDFTKIGVDGYFPGTLLTVIDFRPPLFNVIDPDMKPFTQREISLGFEKKLAENMSLSLRLVNKKVLWAIEDIGVPIEEFYYTNPGSPYIKQIFEERRQNGLFLPGTPDCPKAKRDYYAMNLSLEKRFSDNWQGGISYTLSSLRGNYSGLASSDEDGRNSPNGERYFDMWHLSYDKELNPIDGPLPTDRPHSIKAYGSYALPFGLTVGLVANAYSGTPVTEEWNVDSVGYFPYNRGNMGRTPFIFLANAYIEYRISLGGHRALSFNLNVDNVFNARTATRIYTTKYRYNISPGDAALISTDWEPSPDEVVDPRFGMKYGFLAPISGRLGMRFSF